MTPEKDGMTPSKPVLNLRRESRGRPTDRLDDQVDEAVSIWNDVLGHVLPKSKAEIPAGRRASLRARLADEMGGQLENWRSFCQRVRAAPFLVGESERGWRADLDWCLKPANMTKILAGNYDQRSATPVHRPGHSYAGCL